MSKSLTYSKSEKTKQFIIEQVAPIFNKKGYEGTSLSDMTEATGLTKGAIYGNFKNKEEIAIEAFKYNLGVITNIFARDLSQGKTSLEKLHRLPTIFEKVYIQILFIGGCPLLNTLVDSDNNNSTLHLIAVRSLKRLKQTIKSIISEGIKEGSILENTSPDNISALILTLLEGGILISKSLENEEYFKTMIGQVESIIVNMKV